MQGKNRYETSLVHTAKSGSNHKTTVLLQINDSSHGRQWCTLSRLHCARPHCADIEITGANIRREHLKLMSEVGFALWMFSDNLCMAARLLRSLIHSKQEPKKMFSEHTGWWCLMADGGELNVLKLDMVSGFPSKNKRDTIHQSRTKMWLKGLYRKTNRHQV